MTNHKVVIAGGGPTGLMLAAELALARVDVAIVERRTTQDVPGSRAGGLHARTLEVLEQRGIAQRFLAEGTAMQTLTFGAPLDLSDFPTRHNYGLALWQRHIERILAAWVDELAVPVYRGREVVDFTQDERGVAIALSEGSAMYADYLVGCDGGRSIVRKRAGIDFAGWDASTSYLIAEVEFAEDPPWGLRRDAKGTHGIGKADDGVHARVVLEEPRVGHGDAPSLQALRDALVDAFGSDYGVHSPVWLSRFSDASRQATAYRARRVLLAGDAAHVHSPMGGQGLNTGVQDAVNLGWKLAQVVHGASPDTLLDSYHAERHPVGARVLRTTMACTALQRGDDRSKELHAIVCDLMQLAEPRKRQAGIMSGLDIHYDLGAGHPLLGRRMPDLDIVTTAGATRVYALLHEARPVLIDFTDALDIAPWTPRVRRIAAQYTGAWELPVLGAVDAPSAVLIRPDGYVAWVGDGSERGLRDALTTWCGAPTDLRRGSHLA